MFKTFPWKKFFSRKCFDHFVLFVYKSWQIYIQLYFYCILLICIGKKFSGSQWKMLIQRQATKNCIIQVLQSNPIMILLTSWRTKIFQNEWNFHGSQYHHFVWSWGTPWVPGPFWVTWSLYKCVGSTGLFCILARKRSRLGSSL